MLPIIYQMKLRPISADILNFQIRCEKLCLKILKSEANLTVTQKFFLYGGRYHRINVACFQDERAENKYHVLGEFLAQQSLVNINFEFTRFLSENVLLNLLRHELAHFLTYLDFPHTLMNPHGAEFRNTCKRYGWHEEVFNAELPLPEYLASLQHEAQQQVQNKKIQDKIAKLLALSKSCERHEAELALFKARELMQNFAPLLPQHQTQSQTSFSEPIHYYVYDLLQQKRMTPIMSALYDILPQFSIRLVWHYRKDGLVLEALGTYAQLVSLIPLTDFIIEQLEKWWQEDKIAFKKKGIKLSAKSFFKGVGQGFVQKCKIQQNQENAESRNLELLQKHQLDLYQDMAYPHLQRSRAHHGLDHRSLFLGNLRGKQLELDKKIGKHSLYLE